MLVESVEDYLHDAIEFSVDLIVPETEHAVAGTMQTLISDCIASGFVGERVLRAVNFDN